MDADSPAEGAEPGPSVRARAVLELIAETPFGEWIIERLLLGDEVLLEDDGSWYVGPGRAATP